MLRISKLTDYAVVIMSLMANQPDSLYRANNLAATTNISLATVAKVLKLLQNKNLIHSKRGAKGGYYLAASPEKITVSQIIQAIEGPIAITSCIEHIECCAISDTCPLQSPWNKINYLINSVLDNLSLSQMNNGMLTNGN